VQVEIGIDHNYVMGLKILRGEEEKLEMRLRVEEKKTGH
jgi:hypothetical protein